MFDLPLLCQSRDTPCLCFNFYTTTLHGIFVLRRIYHGKIVPPHSARLRMGDWREALHWANKMEFRYHWAHGNCFWHLNIFGFVCYLLLARCLGWAQKFCLLWIRMIYPIACYFCWTSFCSHSGRIYQTELGAMSLLFAIYYIMFFLFSAVVFSLLTRPAMQIESKISATLTTYFAFASERDLDSKLTFRVLTLEILT